MIEGFKISVTGYELRDHLKARAVYHRERGEAYAKHAEGVQEIQESDDGPVSYSNSPSRGLKESAEKHLKQAFYFEFASEHTVLGETYLLREADLQHIELSPRGW